MVDSIRAAARRRPKPRGVGASRECRPGSMTRPLRLLKHLGAGLSLRHLHHYGIYVYILTSGGHHDHRPKPDFSKRQ